jgi:hypothetical protein
MQGSSGDEGPCSALRWKSKVDSSSKSLKSLFTEKRKERLHEVMQWDPETAGSLGQVGNQVL